MRYSCVILLLQRSLHQPFILIAPNTRTTCYNKRPGFKYVLDCVLSIVYKFSNWKTTMPKHWYVSPYLISIHSLASDSPRSSGLMTRVLKTRDKTYGCPEVKLWCYVLWLQCDLLPQNASKYWDIDNILKIWTSAAQAFSKAKVVVCSIQHWFSTQFRNLVRNWKRPYCTQIMMGLGDVADIVEKRTIKPCRWISILFLNYVSLSTALPLELLYWILINSCLQPLFSHPM